MKAETFFEKGNVRAGRPLVQGEPTTTISVQAVGKSFADLFKEVKKGVSQEVLSVRKGEKDEVGIRVKARDTVAKLTKVIVEKLKGVKVIDVERRASNVIFHVKDLEFDTEAKQVAEGVAAASGCDIGDVRVTSIRPAFGNTQNATVVLAGMAAAGRIKVGWVSCRC